MSKIFSYLVLLSALLVSTFTAEAQTYYFKTPDGAAGNWSNAANWYSNSACTTPAGEIPNSLTADVVILAGQTCYIDVNLPKNVEVDAAYSVPSLTNANTVNVMVHSVKVYGTLRNNQSKVPCVLTLAEGGSFVTESGSTLYMGGDSDEFVLNPVNPNSTNYTVHLYGMVTGCHSNTGIRLPYSTNYDFSEPGFRNLIVFPAHVRFGNKPEGVRFSFVFLGGNPSGNANVGSDSYYVNDYYVAPYTNVGKLYVYRTSTKAYANYQSGGIFSDVTGATDDDLLVPEGKYLTLNTKATFHDLTVDGVVYVNGNQHLFVNSISGNGELVFDAQREYNNFITDNGSSALDNIKYSIKSDLKNYTPTAAQLGENAVVNFTPSASGTLDFSDYPDLHINTITINNGVTTTLCAPKGTVIDITSDLTVNAGGKLIVCDGVSLHVHKSVTTNVTVTDDVVTSQGELILQGGDLMVDHTLTVKGSLDVNGNVSTGNTLAVGENKKGVDSGSLAVTGNLETHGAATIYSHLKVDGKMTAYEAVTFTKDEYNVYCCSAQVGSLELKTENKTLTVNGNLKVNGDVTLAGALTVNSGVSDLPTSGIMTVGGNLIETSVYNANVYGSLTVDWDANLYKVYVGNSNADHLPSLFNVNGDLSSVGEIQVRNCKTNNSSNVLNVGGKVTGADVLGVASKCAMTAGSISLTTANKTLTATGNLRVEGDVTLAGALTVNSGVSDLPTSGIMTVGGNLSVDYGLTVGNDKKDGLYGGLSVAGNVDVKGAVAINSSLNVNGKMTAYNTVNFNKDTNNKYCSTGSIGSLYMVTDNKALTVSGNLQVQNDATLAGALTVNKAVSALPNSGYMSVGGNLSLTNNYKTTVNGKLEVAKAVTSAGELAVSACDASIVNAGVMTAGSITLTTANKTLTATGNLQVEGDVTLAGALTVSKGVATSHNSGYMSVGGNLTLKNDVAKLPNHKATDVTATVSGKLEVASLSCAGALTVNAVDAAIPNSGTLSVTGGALSVLNNKELTLNGLINVTDGSIIVDGGKMNVKATGHVVSRGNVYMSYSQYANVGLIEHCGGVLTYNGLLPLSPNFRICTDGSAGIIASSLSMAETYDDFRLSTLVVEQEATVLAETLEVLGDCTVPFNANFSGNVITNGEAVLGGKSTVIGGSLTHRGSALTLAMDLDLASTLPSGDPKFVLGENTELDVYGSLSIPEGVELTFVSLNVHNSDADIRGSLTVTGGLASFDKQLYVSGENALLDFTNSDVQCIVQGNFTSKDLEPLGLVRICRRSNMMVYGVNTFDSSERLETTCEGEVVAATFYLLNGDGLHWTDAEAWTTNPDQTTPGNPYNRAPSINDRAVIPANRTVILNKDVIGLDQLVVHGTIRIERPELHLSARVMSGSESAVLHVQSMNNIITPIDAANNTLYPVATVAIHRDSDIPLSTFGALDIYGNSTLLGNLEVVRDLTVRSGGTFTIGRPATSPIITWIDDEGSHTFILKGKGDDQGYELDGVLYNKKQPDNSPQNYHNDLGKTNTPLPDALNFFFTAHVGGNVLVEDGAVFQAAKTTWGSTDPDRCWLLLHSKSGLRQINDLYIGGSFVVNGRVKFVENYQGGAPKHGSMGSNDRKVSVHFVGSKNAEFRVDGNNAQCDLWNYTCEKTDNAELFVNCSRKTTLAELHAGVEPQIATYAKLRSLDQDYKEYPVVLVSGVLRLGNNIVVSGTGGTRNMFGDPVSKDRTTILYNPNRNCDVQGHEVPCYKQTSFANDAVFANKEYKYKLIVDGVEQPETKTTITAFEYWRQCRDNAFTIPDGATLWIDGATIEVGTATGDATSVSEETSTGIAYMYEKFFGHIILRGNLKMTGGELVLPNYSVGIIYDDPDFNSNSAASIDIADGAIIHTPRLLGLHNRKLSLHMSSGAKLYFDKIPSLPSSAASVTKYGVNGYQKYEVQLFTDHGISDPIYGEKRYITREEGVTFNLTAGSDIVISRTDEDAEECEVLFQNNEQNPSTIGTLLVEDGVSSSIKGGVFTFSGPADHKNLVFDGTLKDYTCYVPSNFSFYDLSTNGAQKVTFWGKDANLNWAYNDPGDRGYAVGSVHVDGRLNVDFMKGGQLILPKSFYLNGDAFVLTDDSELRPIVALTDQPGNLQGVDFIFGGGSNSYYEVDQGTSGFPVVRDFVLNKATAENILSVVGLPATIYGNLTLTRGSLDTDDASTFDSDGLSGIVLVGSKPVVSVARNANAESASVTIRKAAQGANGEVSLASDLVLKQMLFLPSEDRIVNLGVRNLTLYKPLVGMTNTMTQTGKFFRFQNPMANNFLTLPLDVSAGEPSVVHIGSAANGAKSGYSPVAITSSSAISGSAVSFSVSPTVHPALSDDEQVNALPYYWRINWKDESVLGGKDMEYTVDWSNLYQNGDLSSFTPPLNQGTFSKYQYTSKGWFESTGSVDEHDKSASFEVKLATDGVCAPSGDFTLGHDFSAQGGIDYYAFKSGNWNDPDVWSTSPDEYLPNGDFPRRYVDNAFVGKYISSSPDGDIVISVSHDNLRSGLITLGQEGSVVVGETTSGHKAQSIVGNGGSICYRGNPNFNNVISADYTHIADVPQSTVVFSNISGDDWSEAVLPQSISVFPNLIVEGRVVASCASGFIVNGNLTLRPNEVGKALFLLREDGGVRSGDVIEVLGTTTVEEGAAFEMCQYNTYHSDYNYKLYGDVVNNGRMRMVSGALCIYSNVTLNGTLEASGSAVLRFLDENATTIKGSGSITMPSSNSFIDVDKSHAYDPIVINVPLVTSGNVVPLGLTRGSITFANAQDNLSFRTTSWNGYEYPVNGFFDLPEDVSITVSNGAKLQMQGSDAMSVRLGGSLVADGGTLSTPNGFGYTASGTANLKLLGSSKFSASQLAPFGTNGSLSYQQASKAVVNIGGAGLKNPVWGVVDIKGGRFVQNNNAKINILSLPDNSSIPTLNFTPSNSTFGSGAGFVVDVNNVADDGPMAYVFSSKPLEDFRVVKGSKVATTCNIEFNGLLDVKGEYHSQGYSLQLNSNAVFDGLFDAQKNTVYLRPNGAQTLSGTSDVHFYNLDKDYNYLTTISLDNVTVENNIDLHDGVTNVAKAPVKVLGRVYVNAIASVAGEGVEMCNDSKQQTLVLHGKISKLNINNPKGVDASTHQTYPIYISDRLIMTQGIFAIAKNELVLGPDALIVNGNDVDFGIDKMITTNLSASDLAVRKELSASSQAQSVYIPFGNLDTHKFVPVVFEVSNCQTSSADAYVQIKPVNVLCDGIDNVAADHILQSYCQLLPVGVKFLSGSLTYRDVLSNARGFDHAESQLAECGAYVTATMFENLSTWVAGNGDVSVDGDNIVLYFPFDNVSTDRLRGFYLAGCNRYIPLSVQAYISVNSGDWNADAIWRPYDPITGETDLSAPALALTDDMLSGRAIYIGSNTNVVIKQNGKRTSAVTIMPDATLNLGKTINHIFGLVRGSGTLYLETGSLPSGDYADFCRRYTGGTIHYGGSGDFEVLSSMTVVNKLTFTGSGKRYLRTDDVITDVFGDLHVNGTNLQIVSAKDRTVRVYEDVYLDNGEITGEGIFRFAGDEQQSVFSTSGKAKLAGVEIYNENGGVTVDNGVNFIVSNKLVLSRGVIRIGENNYLEVTNSSVDCVEGGNSTSYVAGNMIRNVTRSNSFFYPVGDESNGGRYGFISVVPETNGKILARYYNSNSPVEYKDGDAAVTASCISECWHVGTVGSKAINCRFKLRWDAQSNVNPYDEATFKVYYNTGAMNWSTWNYFVDENDISGDVTGIFTTLNPKSAGLISTSQPSSNKKGLFLAFAHVAGDAYTWRGTASSDWFTAANWLGHIVPKNTNDVFFDASFVNPPVIDAGSNVAVARNISFRDKNVVLTVENGGNLFVANSVTYAEGANAQIVINHHYDKMCSFSANSVLDANGNNAMVVVNRAIRPFVMYYMGSATFEGTISEGVSDYDYCDLYDPYSETYVANATHDFQNNGWLGASVGIGADDYDATEVSFQQIGSVHPRNQQESFSLSFKDGADYGWNLLSNPFSFTVPLKPTKTSSGVINYFDFNGDVSQVVWLPHYDVVSDQNIFQTYSFAVQEGVAQGEFSSSLGASEYVLPAHQGFFVKRTKTSNQLSRDAKIVVRGDLVTSDRLNAYGDIHLKASEVVNDVLRLSLSSRESISDEIAIVLRDGGRSEAFNGDAEKYPLSEFSNSLAAVKGGVRMAIPFMPSMSELGEVSIPLAVRLSAASSSGVISATNLDVFDEAVDVFLNDAITGRCVNLRDVARYSFVASAGVELRNRFSLSLVRRLQAEDLSEPSVLTNVPELSADNVTIGQDDEFNAIVTVSPALISQGTMIKVFDISGREVSKAAVVSATTVAPLGEAKGVYVVEVSNPVSVFRAKLIK